MINGIILINKEAGFTSHDVVAKLRGIMKQKKIGHTGTLDPDATGVLPVCMGSATKVCDLLTDKDKTYVARLRLGVETDTMDATGEIVKTSPVTWDMERISQVIKGFIGEQDQIPPMYSAIKVNGKKLYELAREGKTIERKPRRIIIHELRVLEVFPEQKELSLEVTCSKGTYIRSLCHDIGQVLGCGGIMASLVRTRVGSFQLNQTVTLDEISRRMETGTGMECILPVDSVFQKYPSVKVLPEAMKYILNGNELKLTQVSYISDSLIALPTGAREASWAESESGEDGSFLRVYSSEGDFLAIYKKQGRKLTPIKMFLSH